VTSTTNHTITNHTITNHATPPARRVLGRDEMLAIAQKLLSASDRWYTVSVEHVALAVTKVANNRVLQTQDGDRVRFYLASRYGSGLPVTIMANQLNDRTLQRILTMVEQMAPPSRPASQIEPDDPDDPQHFTYNAKPIPPVSLWYDSTSRAMDTARGDVIPALIKQIHDADLIGAATVGSAARSVVYLYKQGLTAFADETDNEITVTARAQDGTSSGWSGAAHRDWSKLSPSTVAARAIELSKMSRHPVALEPGRRTAILGPAAVAQLIYQMAEAFDGERTRRGMTPLSDLTHAGGRSTKLGRRVFDPRLVFSSDPSDPEGGFPPFFEWGGLEWGAVGYPTAPVTWVDKGILTNLAYNAGGAASRRLPAADVPRSARLMAAPGTQTATIDEMIANCKEGVYVNRFSDIELVDPLTMLMTGVTRDGCFFIKDGKIVKPIKNFRFTESPFFSFNKVEMIGAPERVAFGAPRTRSEAQLRWPRLPVIAPALTVQDFNFTATADAV